MLLQYTLTGTKCVAGRCDVRDPGDLIQSVNAPLQTVKGFTDMALTFSC
jgi:hypothetical protein